MLKKMSKMKNQNQKLTRLRVIKNCLIKLEMDYGRQRENMEILWWILKLQKQKVGIKRNN
ncbi:MAG: hypothetical protein EB125_05245 [Betaproteobacteria bacterium]|nr:hypothetical protein [Betaproteobacteria bacterium]